MGKGKFLMKHTGMPIPDLYLDYEIDRGRHVVQIRLDDHLDSQLLIWFARQVLEQQEGIRVIDDKSHETWGPAGIPGRFEIELTLAGTLFDVRIVQLGAWLQAKGSPPQFTISMHARGGE